VRHGIGSRRGSFFFWYTKSDYSQALAVCTAYAAECTFTNGPGYWAGYWDTDRPVVVYDELNVVAIPVPCCLCIESAYYRYNASGIYPIPPLNSLSAHTTDARPATAAVYSVHRDPPPWAGGEDTTLASFYFERFDLRTGGSQFSRTITETELRHLLDPLCCEAMTPACLACKEGMLEAEWCLLHPGEYGCPLRPTCTSDADCPRQQSCCSWDNELGEHTTGMCADMCLEGSLSPAPPPPPSPRPWARRPRPSPPTGARLECPAVAPQPGSSCADCDERSTCCWSSYASQGAFCSCRRSEVCSSVRCFQGPPEGACAAHDRGCSYDRVCCPNGACFNTTKAECMDGTWQLMVMDIMCPAPPSASSPSRSPPPPPPPPVYELMVRGNSPQGSRHGERVTFRLIGGEPSAKPIVMYSLKGLGSTDLPRLGVTLDLKRPTQLSVPTRADRNGAAEWSMQIPANAPIGPVFFQAVKYGSVSNVVESEILPGEYRPQPGE